MSIDSSSAVLDRLVDPLSLCLTPESAKRVLLLRADSGLQRLADEMADRCTEGTLDARERAEYANYVAFSTFIAVLKSKARRKLAESAEPS
jgi:hypothetical protein